MTQTMTRPVRLVTQLLAVVVVGLALSLAAVGVQTATAGPAAATHCVSTTADTGAEDCSGTAKREDVTYKVNAAALDLKDTILEIGKKVLPYAAGLVALSAGWRFGKRFVKG